MLKTKIYECWVSDKPRSFVKLTTQQEVELWVRGQLVNLNTHDRIHVVLHTSDEYETSLAVV